MDGSDLTLDREIATSIPHTIHGGVLTLQSNITFKSQLTLDGVDLIFEEGILVVLESSFSILGDCNIIGPNAEMKVYGPFVIQQTSFLTLNIPTIFDFSHSSSFVLLEFLLDGKIINKEEMTFVLDEDSMDISGDGRIINDGWLEISCESEKCNFGIDSEIVGSGEVFVERNTSVTFLSIQAKTMLVSGKVTVKNWKGSLLNASSIVLDDPDAALSFSSDNSVERIHLLQGLQKTTR